MNDLWAEDILTETPIRTPIAILKEQASLLGKKTQNVVLAEVVPISGANFYLRFNIKAPALGNYSYTLFTIIHSIGLYPLEIELDDDVAKELGLDITRSTPVKDEEELIQLLDRVLKAERTKHIIRALLAQSTQNE